MKFIRTDDRAGSKMQSPEADDPVADDPEVDKFDADTLVAFN